MPAALELMDQACIRAVEASIFAAGYPTDAGAILLVELDGQDAAVAAESAEVERLLTANGARTVRAASSPDERARLWQGRKKAFGAAGRIAPDLVVQDAVVPRSALPEILERITEIGERYQLLISNVFHAGDGNLHPNISYDSRDPSLRERVKLASRESMAICVGAGGSITGEHGVGVEKRDYLPDMFNADEMDCMMRLRAAYDPHGIANPGKMFPGGEAPALLQHGLHPLEKAGVISRE